MINVKPYLHKKTMMIMLYLLLFSTIVISVVSLNQRVWYDYSVNNNKLFSSSKTNIDNAFLQISSSITTSSPTDKLNNLAKVQSKLTNDIKSYCEISSVIKWQNIVSQYSNKINDCEHQKKQLGQLLNNMGEIVSYLKAEQGLAAIILAANGETIQNNQADKWNVIEIFWRQAAKSTLELAGPIQFKDIKTLASDDFDKIADAWKQLSDANDAKNRQQFENAQSKLKQAYALLAEISASGETQMKKLTSSLVSNYTQVY
jgi:phage FluMu protein gp41